MNSQGPIFSLKHWVLIIKKKTNFLLCNGLSVAYLLCHMTSRAVGQTGAFGGLVLAHGPHVWLFALGRSIWLLRLCPVTPTSTHSQCQSQHNCNFHFCKIWFVALSMYVKWMHFLFFPVSLQLFSFSSYVESVTWCLYLRLKKNGQKYKPCKVNQEWF